MKELKEIINHYKQNAHGLQCALVCIVQVNGSSYRKPGARILLLENGEFTGSISGGCLDGDALKKAQKVIYSGRPQLVRYDTTQENDSPIGLGLGCQGIIDVLIQPLDNEGYEIGQLQEIVDSRKPLVMVQAIDSKTISNSILYPADQALHIEDDALRQAVTTSFKKERSSLATIDQQRYSIQYYTPAIHLVVCGHQYDSLVLSELAEKIGWKTTIYGKLQKIYYKGQITRNCIENDQPLPDADPFTAFIIMSHDIDTDIRNLKRALSEQASYIGLLGPIDRRNKIFDTLEKEFTRQLLLEQIFTPVGLDIGARTPEEIAIAIIAEVTMYFSNTTGQPLTKVKGGT
ncbi:MAG: hypothetical protein HKN09_03135 [Saprospiraceae bacterium]|nr:hypothetical protein [Saprospiraceae bacterium]